MNKAAITAVVAFIGGAAVGCCASYIFLNKKFNEDLDEAVDNVKSFYKTKYHDDVDNSSNDDISENEPETESVQSVESVNTAITNYSTSVTQFKDEDIFQDSDDTIDVISEDEYYGAIREGIEPTEYMYYADHILADECSDVIDNIEDTVGRDALSRFGDENVDSVYVHNKRLDMYIEILRSAKEYKEDYAYKL